MVQHLFAIIVLLASPGSAAFAGTATPDSLTRFDAWIGDWTGTGWKVSQTGERITFTITERVSRKAGGTVVFAEGRGIATTPAHAGETTHDGFAAIYYDEQRKRFRWHGHDAGLAVVDTDVTITPTGLQWTISASGNARVRFTLELSLHEWREWGEVSTDGMTWTRIMEMAMTK